MWAEVDLHFESPYDKDYEDSSASGGMLMAVNVCPIAVINAPLERVVGSAVRTCPL